MSAARSQVATPGPAAPAPAAPALRHVPGLEGGEAPCVLRRLEGGSVNDSWYVESALGRFVLRVDGPAWCRPGVDRVRERALHGVAEARGLAPRVLRWDIDAGVQVREFVAGRAWSAPDLADPARLRRLGGLLSRLHACAPPAPDLPLQVFDPARIAREYLDRAARSGRPLPDPESRQLLGQLQRAVDEVAATGNVPAVVHGDLTPANLVEGDQLWLIDFEYAQVADPLYDYGCLLAVQPPLLAELARLLADSAIAAPRRALLAARDVHAILERTWSLAREVESAAGIAPRARAN